MLRIKQFIKAYTERYKAVPRATVAQTCRIKSGVIWKMPWCHETPPISRRYHNVLFSLTASAVPRFTNPVAQTVSAQIFDPAGSHTYPGSELFREWALSRGRFRGEKKRGCASREGVGERSVRQPRNVICFTNAVSRRCGLLRCARYTVKGSTGGNKP